MTTQSSGGTPDDDYEDQDAEPTMNAPEEGRPDGLEALKPDDDQDAATEED